MPAPGRQDYLWPDYDADEYLAFVESSDDLDPKNHEVKLPEWWERIVAERERLDRPEPDHLIWLDCVHARSFEALPWRDEACAIGDEVAAARRRQQIIELAPQLIVAPLLVTRRFSAEGLLLADLGEAAWHRVRLGKSGVIPTVIAPDFDLEPDSCRWVYFTYHSTCTEPERLGLENVFNLNFLPEATLGGERGGPRETPPPDGGGGPGKGTLTLADWQRLQERYTSR